MKIKIIKFYRSIVVLFAFVLFGLGAMFIRYCIFPFNNQKIKQYEILQKSWQIFINFLKVTKIIKIKSDDIEKIKNIKNSIIVSTHPSFLDIVILMSLIPHSTCFVAEKLTRNPFLKGMVARLFILEGQSAEVLVKQACESVKAGLNIIIFPMGIRHRSNEYPKIRRGVGLIARATGKSIVVLKMSTNFDFLQINQSILEAGAEEVIYDIKYLADIDTEKFSEKYHDEVSYKTEIVREISHYLYSL